MFALSHSARKLIPWVERCLDRQLAIDRDGLLDLRDPAGRLSENALLPKLFVILKKIILGISTICLWLFFQVFLDFEQNCYSRTAS